MAVPYYGDFAEDDTVIIPFNTFDSNDPSASVTMTTLIDSDIKVHKDGGVTAIATDGATVVINFNSQTGAHQVTIDTSAHADYATGSEYAVLIEGATVDGGNVTAWVGAFSIERAGGVLATLKAGTTKVDVETIKTQAVTCGAGVTVRADVGAAAAPGAANGMFIGGTNAATTVASLSCTGQADAGNILVDSTAVITTDATISGNLLITGTTTHTGAVTLTNGINAGAVSGTLAADIITAASINTGAFSADAFAADALVAATFATDSIAADALAADALAEIKTQATDALTDINLDHLLKTTTGVAADADLEAYVGAGTVMSHLMSTGADVTTFKPSTDSLEAIKVHADTIKAETALIVGDTNELQTDWVNGGRLDLLLDGAASAGDPWTTAIPGAYGAGTAGKIVGDNLDAAMSTRTKPADTQAAVTLVDTCTTNTDLTAMNTIEGAITLPQAIQAILAFAAGKASGGGTATLLFRDQADTKNRISMTVDADGNRTSITLSSD